MKKIFLISITLLTAGCVMVSEEKIVTGSFPREVKAITQLRSVRVGMPKSDVRSLLDEQIPIGYEQTLASAPTQGTYMPLMLNNPYRFETLKKGRRVFEVYYYFIGIRQADGKITDDELIPIVFENDKLVGKGWHFLKTSIPTPG